MAYAGARHLQQELIEWCEFAKSSSNSWPFTFHIFLFRKQTHQIEIIVDEFMTGMRTDRTGFVSMMNACDAVLTTSGVQAPNECLIMRKPMVVVPGHDELEQYCNACELSKQYSGIFAQTSFCDLRNIFAYLLAHKNHKDLEYEEQCQRVEIWLASGTDRFVDIMKQVLIV